MELNLDLKDNIKGTAVFQYYRMGSLWYKTSTGLIFPVPIQDTGDGTFNVEEKAMLLMRYIRKHLDSLKTQPSA